MKTKHHTCHMCGMAQWLNIKDNQPEAGEQILGCWCPNKGSHPEYIAGMAIVLEYTDGDMWCVTNENDTLEINFWTPIIEPDWSSLQ
jgi:hypothetical protein